MPVFSLPSFKNKLQLIILKTWDFYKEFQILEKCRYHCKVCIKNKENECDKFFKSSSFCTSSTGIFLNEK